MAFDPNEPRDAAGKWAGSGSSGSGVGGQGATAKARDAVQWLKSDEARAAIKKLSHPEHIKSAATMAIQSALFNIGVNDPHIDQAVAHQVKSFAHNAQVTRAHARQLMITAVRALKQVRR